MERWNERVRLATLRSYGLETQPDLESLSELAELAATLCGKPMAIISLVEDERQWAVARYGFDHEVLPLDRSICAQIMRGPSISVIEDTRTDPRTAMNPLCIADAGVRFYAGAPLVADNGHPLGALAVLDRVPGTLDARARHYLGVLSRQAMAQLDLHRALRRADIMRREVDHRVKNSLQSVASLARMQAKRVSSPEAKDALQTVSRRIATVAALNAQLYRGGSERHVPLGQFLGSVADLIRESAPPGITVRASIEDGNVSAAQAGAIAVVVNEFCTNAFKHAFPDGRTGTITVEGRRMDLGRYAITVRDDGVGFDRANAGEGLGLAIIESAVDGLSGDLSYESEGPGFGVTVIFGL